MSLFEQFLTVFQTQGPMIHILHEHMQGALRKLLQRFLKPCNFEGKTASEMRHIDCSTRCQLDDMAIGSKASEMLQRISSERQTVALEDVRMFSSRQHLI